MPISNHLIIFYTKKGQVKDEVSLKFFLQTRIAKPLECGVAVLEVKNILSLLENSIL